MARRSLSRSVWRLCASLARARVARALLGRRTLRAALLVWWPECGGWSVDCHLGCGASRILRRGDAEPEPLSLGPGGFHASSAVSRHRASRPSASVLAHRYRGDAVAAASGLSSRGLVSAAGSCRAFRRGFPGAEREARDGGRWWLSRGPRWRGTTPPRPTRGGWGHQLAVAEGAGLFDEQRRDFVALGVELELDVHGPPGAVRWCVGGHAARFGPTLPDGRDCSASSRYRFGRKRRR